MECIEQGAGGSVPRRGLMMSKAASMRQQLAGLAGEGILLLVTMVSLFAVLFIFYFIAKDAFPFFKLEGFREFFGSTRWYPSGEPAEFGAQSIFFGTFIVTVGATIVAVPLGVCAAVCLSDLLPFSMRQLVKPVIEMLAAIPSVAYGFFAIVVFAPLLQDSGGRVLGIATWLVLAPIAMLAAVVVSDMGTDKLSGPARGWVRLGVAVVLGVVFYGLIQRLSAHVGSFEVVSGANALNVSVILGIMALPTVVSVSEDALQAVGRELREGSYALGATRAETLLKVILPAASSGICAAVILGLMRAVGETMVVWMASGNAARIPSPFFDLLEPVRTLTATIAGDMGEADHVTGSSRYHVLFAMAFCLLSFSFGLNIVSEWVVNRARKVTGK